MSFIALGGDIANIRWNEPIIMHSFHLGPTQLKNLLSLDVSGTQDFM